jgi:hypothetical protein
VSKYLDLGVLNTNYDYLEIKNNANIMVNTFEKKVVIHDIIVSVNSSLFDVKIKLN